MAATPTAKRGRVIPSSTGASTGVIRQRPETPLSDTLSDMKRSTSSTAIAAPLTATAAVTPQQQHQRAVAAAMIATRSSSPPRENAPTAPKYELHPRLAYGAHELPSGAVCWLDDRSLVCSFMILDIIIIMVLSNGS